MELDLEYSGVEKRGAVDGVECITGIVGDDGDDVDHGMMYTETGFNPGKLTTSDAAIMIEDLQEKAEIAREKGMTEEALEYEGKITVLKNWQTASKSYDDVGKTQGLVTKTKKKLREAIKRALEQLETKHPAAAAHFHERIKFGRDWVKYDAGRTQWEV